MPELPEIETIKQGLTPLVEGKKITKIHVSNPNLRWKVPEDIGMRCEKKIIHQLSRRSKYLLVKLSDNEHIIIHLGMSGSLTYHDDQPKPRKHDHITITLDQGYILYNDPRRFGCVLYHQGHISKHRLLTSIGPEPTDPTLNPEHLYQKLKTSHRLIKVALMDAHIIPGIGNIYANEALFRANIHPEQRCNDLHRDQFIRLQQQAIITLKDAIAQGGTTLKDFLSADGKPGYFQQSLNVYGRESQPCFICNTRIKMTRTAARATYFCPKCQKETKA